MQRLSNPWRLTGASVMSGVLAAALGWAIWEHGARVGLVESHHKLFTFLLLILTALVAFSLPRLLLQLKRQSHREQGVARNVYPPNEVSQAPLSPSTPPQAELLLHLYEHHGRLWRRKLRLLLVVGEPEQIEAIAPGLVEQKWQEGEGVLLLWGGDIHAETAPALFSQWHGLSLWRPLDGAVWALTQAQSADPISIRNGMRHLRQLAHDLHWQLPLHLWQVCASEWSQATRQTQPVGTLMPVPFNVGQLQASLDGLLVPLRREGMVQMRQLMAHDFLYRLARDLEAEGVAHWRQVLGPWLGVLGRSVPLRGLWFSLPLPRAVNEGPHVWPPTSSWQGIVDDSGGRVRRLGWPVTRVGHVALLTLAAAWGAGLLVSAASNRAQTGQLHTTLAALAQRNDADGQLLGLNELARELNRLIYRTEHGAPWHQRFGLDQTADLLDVLWPRFIEANNRLIRDPAAKALEARLRALVQLPPDSPERTRQAHAAYQQLQAYLMMARPEKVDADFLAGTLGRLEPLRQSGSSGLWQGLAPNLWQFYADHLAAHPQWRIETDSLLVTQVRQILLGQLGQRNAEASVYRQLLEEAAPHYPDLGLAHMLGETRGLFSTTASVPGVFTRQAWEGQVRQAIERIAQARREEVDWVLSEKPFDIDPMLAPEVLKARLTERYFQEYASAWLDFLDSLRWHRADSLSEVIEQLSLMSDTRQSPLIALMNTLAYQGQAGGRRQALGDSLIQSAQQLLAQDKVMSLELQAQGPANPLDATFGPLLNLLGKGAEGQAGLSLQAFLTRVTSVRLKLQQVSTAADPQAMTRAEWESVGRTLFVQPLEQAWQRVLQPSAVSLNRQWQQSVVSDWQAAFTGRYPFAATSSDASLPMLGQMIRADSGRIEQFLQRQLGGVLHKDGSQWVVDPTLSQGLTFNPQFLMAVNQLSHLADVLYTDGGLGLGFELQGKAVRDVEQTRFVLNGQEHLYFNQKESWQRFNWPGRSDYPGASLSVSAFGRTTREPGD